MIDSESVTAKIMPFQGNELTLAEYSDFNCDKNKYPYHEYDLTYIAKAGCSEKSMIRYIYPVQEGEEIQQLCNNIFNITIKQI